MFHFEPKRKNKRKVLLKSGTRDSQYSPPFERSACFHVTICKNFERFLTLKQNFWKTESFLKKLEYRFLFESTKIENASFSYKTTPSEVNVKINRMVSRKWTKQHKTTSYYFIVLKILFQV